MSSIRKFLAVIIAIFIVSCGSSITTPTPKPKPTAIPVPDIPIYQNSFEEIADLATSGITSNVEVTIETGNFNYPGGGTALRVEGVLPGEQYSNLYMDLSIKGLTGEQSVDLTNKTIYFSAFIPADAAIDTISIYAGEGGQFVRLAGITSGTAEDDYWKKGVWHDYHFDLSHAGFMKGTDTIRIAGSRESSGEQAATYFLVDDLKWIRSDSFKIPKNDSIDSLRKYAQDQHFLFGLFSPGFIVFGPEDDPVKNTIYDTKDPWYAYEVVQEGSVNAGIFFPIPETGEDYSDFNADPVKNAGAIQMNKFGKTYSMTVLGYGIGAMYSSSPEWVRNLGYPDATKALLLFHIEKQLLFTKGQNPIWLLFNEFTLPIEYGTGLKNRQVALLGVDGWDYGEGNHYSPWAADKHDSSLIEAAILKAHAVDADATLLLNDFNDNEQIGLKTADYLFQFVSGLKDKGIPIDGVGFQLHNTIEPAGTLMFRVPFVYPWKYEHISLDTYFKNLDLNVKRYAGKGLNVAFTEVEGQIKIDDIDLDTPDGRVEYDKRLQWQARYYAGLLKIAMENENVIMFHIWGVTDRYANPFYFEGYGNGFIFDKNYHPKPAYYAMLELLKGK